jgi:hypothetical protein
MLPMLFVNLVLYVLLVCNTNKLPVLQLMILFVLIASTVLLELSMKLHLVPPPTESVQLALFVQEVLLLVLEASLPLPIVVALPILFVGIVLIAQVRNMSQPLVPPLLTEFA